MKLYHYTSAEALVSILERGKLWASDIRYLNDSNEYKEGVEIINTVFNTNINNLPTNNPQKSRVQKIYDNAIARSKNSFTFIVSFSETKDLLSQWRGYCPQGGYAIEFDVPEQKDFSTDFPIHKCIYSQSNKNIEANKLFDLLIKDKKNSPAAIKRLESITWSNFAKFKNEGFHEEKEHRIVRFVDSDSDIIKFRTKKSLIFPYIEVPIPDNYITSIIIGPTQNPDLSRISIQTLLQNLIKNSNRHISHSCSIESSQVPLIL